MLSAYSKALIDTISPTAIWGTSLCNTIVGTVRESKKSIRWKASVSQFHRSEMLIARSLGRLGGSKRQWSVYCICVPLFAFFTHHVNPSAASLFVSSQANGPYQRQTKIKHILAQPCEGEVVQCKGLSVRGISAYPGPECSDSLVPGGEENKSFHPRTAGMAQSISNRWLIKRKCVLFCKAWLSCE